jgi:hypothetical protein
MCPDWSAAPSGISAARAGYILPEYQFYYETYKGIVEKMLRDNVDPRPITNYVVDIEITE